MDETAAPAGYLNAVQNGLTPVCKDMKGARVFLKKTNDGQGYFILTSFPK